MEKQEKKVYTIEDIAKELGVSKTTVSRAISGKGRIGQETRERVLTFIKEHDYRPNVLAKGLAQRKTYNLALLLPRDYATTEFPFFKDCMRGICEVASAYDYDIIISMIDREDLSQLQRLYANRKVDGMIISRTTMSSKAQKYLKDCGVPFVVIGPCSDPEVSFVDNKNQEASEELTRIMLSKGMRTIALLGGNECYNVTGSRYQGFVDAHQKMGICINEKLVFMNVDDQRKVETAVRRALHERADAILCMDDVICGMCLSCLEEQKIKIPSELKIASLYDSRSMKYYKPSITSVQFDTVRLGKMACIKLLKILDEKTKEDEVPMNYQVVLRESTQ